MNGHRSSGPLSVESPPSTTPDCFHGISTQLVTPSLHTVFFICLVTAFFLYHTYILILRAAFSCFPASASAFYPCADFFSSPFYRGTCCLCGPHWAQLSHAEGWPHRWWLDLLWRAKDEQCRAVRSFLRDSIRRPSDGSSCPCRANPRALSTERRTRSVSESNHCCIHPSCNHLGKTEVWPWKNPLTIQPCFRERFSRTHGIPTRREVWQQLSRGNKTDLLPEMRRRDMWAAMIE